MNVARSLIFSSFLSAFLTNVSFAYPQVQERPSPMCSTQFQSSCAFFKGGEKAGISTSGASYKSNGSLATCSVTKVQQKTFDEVNYLLSKLPDSCGDTVTFNKEKYVVFSAVPEITTLSYAYKNASVYYEPEEFVFPAPFTTNSTVVYLQKQIKSDEDPIPDSNNQPIPSMINGGKPTSLISASENSHSNPGRTVALYQNDAKSIIYLPHIPDYTDHVLWSVDGYLNAPSAFPNDGSQRQFHMLGYGWALSPTTVNKQFTIQTLKKDGGSAGVPIVVYQQKGLCKYHRDLPYNVWRLLLKGNEILSPNPLPAEGTCKDEKRTLWTKDELYNDVSQLMNSISGYPLPAIPWFQKGIYLPIRPAPGFQRNLIRWYTPWGAWNILNNTSGLFVRNDGSVEIPLNGTEKIPPVIQTWNGDQRFTLINKTKHVVSSVSTDYPGAENYYQGNAFLPHDQVLTNGSFAAGVLTSTHNYSIYDDQETLRPRQIDGWLGLLGDSPMKAMRWDDAPLGGAESSVKTEPGGQANKPFMWGADASPTIAKGCQGKGCAFTGDYQYNMRLQHSNSFLIARLKKEDIASKVYQASLYVAPKGDDFKKVATLSYEWKPWDIQGVDKGVPQCFDPTNKSINNDLQNWVASQDSYGAVVPYVDVNTDALAGYKPSEKPIGFGQCVDLENNHQLCISTKTSKAISFTNVEPNNPASYRKIKSWCQWDYKKENINQLATDKTNSIFFYTLQASTTSPDVRFLVVLEETGTETKPIHITPEKPEVTDTQVKLAWTVDDKSQNSVNLTSKAVINGITKACLKQENRPMDCSATFDALTPETQYNYELIANNQVTTEKYTSSVTTAASAPDDKGLEYRFGVPANITVAIGTQTIQNGDKFTFSKKTQTSLNLTQADKTVTCTLTSTDDQLNSSCVEIYVDNSGRYIGVPAALPTDGGHTPPPPPPGDKTVTMTLGVPAGFTVSSDKQTGAFTDGQTLVISNGTTVTLSDSQGNSAGCTLQVDDALTVSASSGSLCNQGLVVDSTGKRLNFPAAIPSGGDQPGGGGTQYTVGVPSNITVIFNNKTIGNAGQIAIQDKVIITIGDGNNEIDCEITVDLSGNMDSNCNGLSLQKELLYIGIPAALPTLKQ